MELLISAATPRQLLVGKVLGVGGAGLTQYVAILIPASAVVLLQDRIAAFILGPARAGGDQPLVGLSLPILAAFGSFFLLGFVLYALLYAAAGSLVSRQDDVQQLALPLSLVSLASYFVAVLGLSSIGSAPVVVLSFVPFSSPFVMLARVMLGRVQPWEVALSMAILVASSALVLWLAARIYATGVLLYGQRAGFRAFIRAARTAGS
jgi:ABC-2 type transport system permease protein